MNIIETFSIETIQYDNRKVKLVSFIKSIFILLQTPRKQVSKINKTREERFQTLDKQQIPSVNSRTYLLTMFPVAKGDHIFNSHGEQEWEIQRDTDTKFAIYGM